MTGVSSYMNIIYNLITKTEAPNFKKLLCCISRLQLLGNYLNPQLQVHKEIGIVLVSINFFVIKFFFLPENRECFHQHFFPRKKETQHSLYRPASSHGERWKLPRPAPNGAEGAGSSLAKAVLGQS